MMDGCSGGDIIRLGFEYVALGYFFPLFFYLIFLVIDSRRGWTRIQCENKGDSYLYRAGNSYYRSKVYSASSEVPFESEELPEAFEECYIKETEPERARLVTGFAKLGNASGMALGFFLILALKYYIPGACYEAHQSMAYTLLAGGVVAGTVHALLCRLAAKAVRV